MDSLKREESKGSLVCVRSEQGVSPGPPQNAIQMSIPSPSTFRKANLTTLDKKALIEPESPIPQFKRHESTLTNSLKDLNDFLDDFKLLPEIIGNGAYAQIHKC